MSHSINIQTLAKELKLSASTVSKALHDSHEISQETKNRVLALAAQYQYSPNPYASSLRNKKSKTLGVMLPELGNSFFANVIKGIESVASSQGYHILIYLTNERFEKEQALLNQFQSSRVEGLLMAISAETKQTQHIEELITKGIPLVFFDRVPTNLKAPAVVTNDFELGEQVTQHLLERGCKRITYLGFGPNASITNRRVQGYLETLHRVQLPPNIAQLQPTQPLEQQIEQALSAYQPDGIIAAVEELIVPLYQVCAVHHIQIPNQLKVLSFCDFPTAAILSPSLTTVQHPAFEMGQKATKLLIDAIQKPQLRVAAPPLVLSSKIIMRDSTW